MKTKTPSVKSITKIVDDLGRTKAAIADLEKKEAVLRLELIEADVMEAHGTLFRATVSQHTVEKVDYKSVIACLVQKYGDDLKFFNTVTNLMEEHTKVSERTTVKVVSR